MNPYQVPKKVLRRWFREAKREGAKFLVVIYDPHMSLAGMHHPVHVMPGELLFDAKKRIQEEGTRAVVCEFDVSMRFRLQLKKQLVASVRRVR